MFSKVTSFIVFYCFFDMTNITRIKGLNTGIVGISKTLVPQMDRLRLEIVSGSHSRTMRRDLRGKELI